MRAALALSAFLCLPGAFAAQNQDSRENQTERQFIERAAQIHMSEAHLGQMARDKANSQGVRAFGESVAKDHRDGYQRLSQLAGQFSVTVPKSIDDEHQQAISKFEHLPRDRFDEQYRQYQTTELRQRADWFRQQSNQLQNQDLKRYASDMAAKMEDYQTRAQNMDAQRLRPVETAGAAPSQTQSPADNQSAADAAAPAQPAPQTQSPETGAAPADRQAASTELRGTVTSFEAGKTLEVKLRDRIGQHRYTLTGDNLKVNVPSNLEVGTPVVVTERTDANGFRTLDVRIDDSASESAPAGPDQTR